jgi:lysophospholipase L1-like esterase
MSPVVNRVKAAGPPSRLTVLVLFISTAMLSAGLTGGVADTVGSPSSTARLASTASYVALGESFSAQSGKPVYNEKPCERAPGTYPALVARKLDRVAVNLACSGASSADLLTARQPGAAGPQVEEVAPRARVVTILIGLDDLGAAPFRFIGELSGCQAGNAAAGRVHSCQSLPGMTGPALGRAVSQAGRNLAASLSWLHRHRRAARVLVLDYPAVLGAQGCSADRYLVASDVVVYRSVLDQLNAVIRADAATARDPFVDLYGPSFGPQGCPDWLTPPTATTVFPSHPSAFGEVAMATLVARAVARTLGQRPPPAGSPPGPPAAAPTAGAAGEPASGQISGHGSLLSDLIGWPWGDFDVRPPSIRR